MQSKQERNIEELKLDMKAEQLHDYAQYGKSTTRYNQTDSEHESGC